MALPSPYLAPTRSIGQTGLTDDLNAAYKQLEALTNLYVTPAASQVLTFDKKEQYVYIAQNANLNFSLAGLGNIANCTYRIVIVPDATHSITVSTDFYLSGSLDSGSSEFLVLDFTYFPAPAMSNCTVSHLPLASLNAGGGSGSRTGAASTGGTGGTGGTGTTTQQLAAPTNPGVSAPSQTYANYTASSVANATAYVKERATSADFSQGFVAVTNANAAQTFTGLNAGGTYYFRSKARASGYTDSPYSAVVQVTMPGVSGGQQYGYKFSDAGQIMTIPSSTGMFGGNTPFSVVFNAHLTKATKLFLSQDAGSNATRNMDILVQNGIFGVQLQSADGSAQLWSTPIDDYATSNNYMVVWDGGKVQGSLNVYRDNVALPMGLTTSGPGTFTTIANSGSMKIGSVISASNFSVCDFFDDCYLIPGLALSSSQRGEIFPNKAAQLSFVGNIAAYYRFEQSVADETGQRNATVSTPQYVTAPV